MTIRFVVSVWVIRYLGPEHYGIYTYAISFVALFVAFATLGLDDITIRELVRAPQATGQILATTFVLRLLTAGAMLVVIAAVIFAVEDNMLTRVAVLIIACQLPFRAANIFDLWFQSQVRSKYVVWVRSIAMVLFSGSQVVFVLLGLPLLAFLLPNLAQSVLIALGLFMCFQLVGPKQVRWAFSLARARAMLRDAWPLILSALSISVYMKIDQVMIGQMIGKAEVGIYGAAVKVSEIWYFLPVAIVTSAFPAIVRSREQAPVQIYSKRMQTLYDGMALLGYAVIIPMTLLASPITQLLFGSAYEASAAILQVHIWAFLFMAPWVVQSRWLVAENLAMLSMIMTTLGAVSNIALNLLLIPRFAGLGAAWATLLSYAIAFYVSNLFIPRLRPVFAQLAKSLLIPLRLLSSKTNPWK